MPVYGRSGYKADEINAIWSMDVSSETVMKHKGLNKVHKKHAFS